MSQINYKTKYEQLKLRYMNSVDMAFRLGYEAGAKDAQVDQAAQQAQAQQAQPGQPGEEGEQQPGQDGQEQGQAQPGEEQPADSEHPDGSELDQHIAKLESMISKGEPDSNDLKKTLEGFKAYRKALEMKKAEGHIRAIAKNMSAPKTPLLLKSDKMSEKSAHNLTPSSKAALGMQEKIVSDIMQAWADEGKKASKGIADILAIEGLSKE